MKCVRGHRLFHGRQLRQLQALLPLRFNSCMNKINFFIRVPQGPLTVVMTGFRAVPTFLVTQLDSAEFAPKLLATQLEVGQRPVSAQQAPWVSLQVLSPCLPLAGLL